MGFCMGDLPRTKTIVLFVFFRLFLLSCGSNVQNESNRVEVSESEKMPNENEVTVSFAEVYEDFIKGYDQNKKFDTLIVVGE